VNRYYFFPSLRPEGEYYQLKRTPSAALPFSQQQAAWDGIVEYLACKKWFRRFPFRLQEPWMSWEIDAYQQEMDYYYWTPNPTHGYEIAQRLAVFDPALEVSLRSPPSPVNFNKPHYGYKMQFEKNFCLPLDLDVSIEQALHEYLSRLSQNQRIICQFLIRPVYDYQITSKFTKAYRSLKRSGPSNDEENIRIHAAMLHKQQQCKAEVAIRLFASADSMEESKQILEPCAQILSQSDSSELNCLEWREWWRMIRPMFRYEFRNRLFPFSKKENALIMGTDELSRLIHAPGYTPSSKLPWLGGKRIAEPIDIRNQHDPLEKSIRIGSMVKNLNERPNRLSIQSLESHFAVFGSAQTGKTTTLLNMLVDYMKERTPENRYGYTVLDLQGKLANQLLERIPASLHHLVKVIRFKRGQYPFNYFDIDFATSNHQKARIVMDIFRRLGTDYWTPFVSDHLLYGALALLKLNRATLMNLQLLIEDNEFCQQVMRQLNRAHPVEASMARFFSRYLQNTEQSNWKEEFFLSSMITRLREINMSGMSTTLNHNTNGIRWKEALDQGHFQIFDLSGLNAGDRPRMGASMITLFQHAMLSREPQRTAGEYLPLHPLVIDDASIYLNQAFGDLEYFLHEAKRYRMPLWMGLPGITNYINQSVAESIFRNVKTILSYRLSNATDADFVYEHMHTLGLETQDFQMLDPFYGYLQMAIDNDGQRTYAFTNRGYLPDAPLLTQAEVDQLEMSYLEEVKKREQAWEVVPWKSSSEQEEMLDQKAMGLDGVDEYIQTLYGDSLGTSFLKPF
jgi:hypothetical protein